MASKRNRTHEVTAPKSDKERMTIRISSEELLKMDRAARREAQLESGTYIHGGAHGGDKRTQRRRERREEREKIRRGDW